MRINNQRGEIVTTALIIMAVILGAVFVPNDLSKAAGIQNKQNKIVQKQSTTERIELLKDNNGQPIKAADGSYIVKNVGTVRNYDTDEQQEVTLWERFKALPFVLLVLVCLGAAGVPGFAWVGKLYQNIKKAYAEHRADTKKIVSGVDRALASIPMTLANEKFPGEVDRAALAKRIQDGILNSLSASYDQSTKDLVRQLRG